MRPNALPANDHRSSRNRHLFGFGAAVALALMLIAITLNTFHTARNRERAEAWQLHTMDVLLTTERTRSAVNAALRGERGFLITGDASFLEAYRRGATRAPMLAARLKSLTSDNAVQRTNSASLDSNLQRYLAVLEKTITLTRAGNKQDAVSVVRSGIGRQEIESTLEALSRIEAVERRLLEHREIANARATRAAERGELALSGLAFVFLLIVVWAGITASRARMHTLGMEAQLRRAATTDELTELLNRRAFLERLDTEIARTERGGAPLSIALIDLDHFKSVNDRFGHQGGDEVLRRFAEVARESVRATDVVGRLGGEEFAVLMPETSHAEAGVAAERLRTAIADRQIALQSGARLKQTISLGVANLSPDEDRDRLILRADEALYDAKHDGRNRTRLAA